MAVESLEQRMALTAAPSVGLTFASDTGVRGDGITRLSRPVFAGWAPARSSVVVYAAGADGADGQQLLGVTTTTASRMWSLATPAAVPLAAGAHTITAYAFSPSQGWSTPTTLRIVVDPPPTASIAYDSDNGRAIVTFSKPVSGVRLSSLILSGQTQSGVTIPNVPINDFRARRYVGVITLSPSPDGRTFTFQEQLTLAEPGTYTLSFARTGVVDRAGNPLGPVAATSFRII
jgi:hypothetical protein